MIYLFKDCIENLLKFSFGGIDGLFVKYQCGFEIMNIWIWIILRSEDV